MVAGPFCGKLLGEMGANVVKVEPLTGDPARRIPPFVPGESDYGAVFLYCNARKRSVTLDPSQPAGRDLFHQMLDRADVFVSDAPLSELEELGLTPQEIRDRWPALVTVSIRAYGLTGPLSEAPAQELDTFHSGGEGIQLPAGLSYERFPERQPVKAGRNLAGYDAGWIAATLAGAALISRERTGTGEVIDVSQQDVQISLNRVNLDAQLNVGKELGRADRGYDFGGIFPCKDGYVTVRPNENRHWQALVAGIGRADLAADSRFEDRAGREANFAELNEILLEFFLPRTRIEIYEVLRQCGAPVGYFADVDDIVNDQQFQSRAFFGKVELDGRQVTTPGPTYRMSQTPALPPTSAPRLGADSAQVYGELGVECSRISDLRTASVI